MSTTANATAARPPATPNHAVLGSIYLPLVAEKTPRSVRLRLSPGQVEGAQVARGRRPLRVDPVDRRPARAFFDRVPELLEFVALSFGDQLHRPVVVVAHPAREPETAGVPLDEVAKADALDVAAHGRVEPLHTYIFHPCRYRASWRSATSWWADSRSTPTRTGWSSACDCSAI